MIDIILVMFIGMKIITTAATKKQKNFHLNFLQWLAFSFGWAGMRAEIFQTLGQKKVEGWKEMLFSGISRVIAGLLIVILAKYIYTLRCYNGINTVIISFLLLVGFSLILHFGLLAISAGIWRYFGVKTYYLFNSPVKSNTLNSFWSKRWNLAFSEMTSIAVYRPLKEKTGNVFAFFLAFLFSGLLHEAAISLPVNKGFGLPLLYFAIQGSVMLFEQFLLKRNITFFNKGIIGKIWLWFWIIAPAPILFHIYFISAVIWPLAGLDYL
jgi:alginate O-acetyltransferase complex protein AlgI